MKKQAETICTEVLVEEEDRPTMIQSKNSTIKVNIKRVKRTWIQHTLIYLKTIISVLLSAPILLILLTIATIQTATTELIDTYYYKKKRPQENQESLIPNEFISADETYYASRWGYKSEPHQVVTEDGYILTMYRISKKANKGPRGKPVLIGHGLFQCSGAFVLNEKKSLSFALIDQGYDVWVGNNRSIASLDHISLSHEDQEYWNWGLKELGMYDFPAMVEHVCSMTGFSKVSII